MHFEGSTHIEGTGGEKTYRLDEGLAAHFPEFLFGEGYALACEHGYGSYLFVYDEIVGFHEAVFTVVDSLYVGVELCAEKYYDHSYEVGKEESCKLRNGYVLTK